MSDYLEDEYREPYDLWKVDPSPASRTAFLKAVDPVIQQGIRTHVGEANPLITSRARQLALRSFDSYDPKRGRLGAHINTQLRGLKRISRQQGQVMRAPERVIYDRARLQRYTQELQDELGREPTDAELSNRTGFSAARIKKVRGYSPGITEGQLEMVDPSLLPGMQQDEREDLAVKLVYDEMPPLDQKIMELTLGLNGQKALSNQEIARKLGRSPGAISQRKARIQQAIDAVLEVNPATM